MKTKKIIIYIGLVAVGAFLGWLLFNNYEKPSSSDNGIDTTKEKKMWTCSMHPQIMQPEPGKCPICGMDLIPAEVGADGLTANQFKLTDNAMALANIQTTVVGNQSLEGNAIKLSGKIAENEEANSVQVTYFSGRLERLNVNFSGEDVRQGQLLATIYSPELYAAQQELITAASLKESQPVLYKAVRNKLKLWKLSDNQIDEIEKTGKVLDNFPVYATVSGTVTEKLVEQGDYVKHGQPLLKIANLNSVWANFDVYENQIDLFKKGQEVLITSNAYPSKEFRGKVDFIDPVLDTKTRTVTLRVVLNNQNDKFKPGMFVQGKINVPMANDGEVVTVPSSAVLWTGERSVVYLKANPEHPVFEMREVVLGNQVGDTYEVLEGLHVGDILVTNGTFTVDAAAQLQGKKSMMNQEGDDAITEQEGHYEMNSKEMKMENERVEVSKTFQSQLKRVYDNYIVLKDALVQGDSSTVKTESFTLLNNLSKVDMELLKGDSHMRWMGIEKEIKSSATEVSKASTLKKQRDYFKNLSSSFIDAIQVFGVNETVYVEFCPMVDNNKGAFWLSREEQILNPYFGKVMLKCGEVKQVIE